LPAGARLPETSDPETLGITVQLVDGGLHDNQGVFGLSDQNCNVMIVSDARGQMSTEDRLADGPLGVLLRTTSLLQARIRTASYRAIESRRNSGRLKGLLFLHRKRNQPEDTKRINFIINEAARAYEGAIPPDCYHQPYMPLAELEQEMERVTFFGWEANGELVGVMGIEPIKDVTLIRHAYVLTACQRKGIGTKLLNHLI